MTIEGAGAARGHVMFIGGGKDQDDLTRHFVNLSSSGPHKTVVIIPLASSDPQKSGKAYVDYITELGHPNVEFLIPGAEPTQKDIETVARAGGLYFSGGDQSRILNTLGAHWLKILNEAWSRGTVIGGTSAGAMVWGASAILEGDPMLTLWHGEDPAHEGIRLMPGFAFLPTLIVDTHFSERGRLGRLVYAAAKQKRAVGLGVDPQTAAVLSPEGQIQVLGRGTATVVEVPDGQPMTAPLSLKGVKIQLLAPGDSYTLANP